MLRRGAGFWACPLNQRLFLDTIAPQLGISKPEDWEGVKHQQIREHKGSSLFMYYRTWSGVLSRLFPNTSFEFNKYAPLFKAYKSHHGFKNNSSWANITLQEVQQFAMKNGYPKPNDSKSLPRWLKITFPEENWALLFPSPRKTRDYWLSKSNIRAFLDQFAADYISSPEDWNQFTTKDIVDFGGKGIFNYYATLHDVLRQVYPDKDWSLLEKKREYGYWSSIENQKEFLTSLAKKRRIQTPKDWQSISIPILREEGGRSLLDHYPSIHDALVALFPKQDWQESKKCSKPRGYWQVKANQRAFFDEFQKTNHIEKQSDWKKMTRKKVVAQGGAQIFRYYPSLFDAVSTVYSEFSWNPYEYISLLPCGFWDDKGHQRGFLDFLAQKYNLRCPEDWKRMNVNMVRKEGGISFLNRFPSFFSSLETLYPHLDWDPVFSRKLVPKNYWKNIDNVKRLVKRVEKHYQVQSLEDWYRISLHQIRTIEGGAGILHAYHSKIIHMLRVVYPEVKWDEERLSTGNKKAAQRWLFITLQKLYTDYQILEEYLCPFNRENGMPVEIDIFIPELSLAFEYHGEQHFNDLPQFGGIELYKTNDKEKLEVCAKHGIQIIVVPYWWDTKKTSLLQLIKEKQTKPHLNKE